MKNVSNKSNRKTRNAHFMLNNTFSKIVPFLRYCGKNVADRGMPQKTIRRMRISCISFRIPKAANTHTGCLLIIALPLQKLSHERASLLRYTCISYLFFLSHWWSHRKAFLLNGKRNLYFYIVMVI